MKDKIFSRLKKYMSEIVSFLIILLLTVVGGAYINSKFYLLGFVFAVLFVLFNVFYRLVSRKRRQEKNKKSELLTNVTVDLLMDMKTPVAILENDGVIVWYNQSFAEKSDDKTLYGTNINELLETKLNMNKLKESLSGTDDTEALVASYSGVKYRVDSYSINSTGEDFFMTVWYDMTSLETLSQKLLDTNPVVSYIFVDTGAESSISMKGDFREVTAKISGVLHEWVSSMNGVLREFERDKYIAVFDNSNVKNITESKCDVLDRVRQATEFSEFSLSVSIGMAILTDATFSEKEQVARQALELAMQRGGDQAVLRFDETSEFYGGRFKAVQKRTKMRSRVIAQDLVNLIKNSGNVLIMGHKFADHDSLGSCIGVAALALDYSTKVNIIVNKNDDNIRSMVEKLESIPKYENIFLDKTAGQDLVSYNTLLVVCDVNNFKIFEAPEIYENVKDVVIIDHHRKTGDFIVEPKITYIEPSASSASELVSEMLEQVIQPGTLLKEEAEALFAGMVLDTKQFSRNTGVRTFSVALYLRGEGASPAEIGNYFKSSLADFTSEAHFESNVVIYRDIIAISLFDGDASPADKISASKAADRLLTIDGVLASFALCRIDNTVHISARSHGTVNVQLILEKLNGGGHFDAAGAQVDDDSVTRVLSSLRDAIDEYLDSIEKKG